MESDGTSNADVDIFERFSRIYKEVRDLKMHTQKITEQLRATRERNVQLAQYQQLIRKELQRAKHELNLLRAENINLRVALKLQTGNSGESQVKDSQNPRGSRSDIRDGICNQGVQSTPPAKPKILVVQKESIVKQESSSELDDNPSYKRPLATQNLLKKPVDVVPKDESEWDDISFSSPTRNIENIVPQSPNSPLIDPHSTLSVSEDSTDLLKRTKQLRRRNSLFSICYKEPSLRAKLRQGDPNTFGETRRTRKHSKRPALKEIN